jgi:hypothetical protein
VIVWGGEGEFGETSEIRGFKWNDLNGNRSWDAGEPGLADWEIYLDLNDNSQWDDGEPKTTTAGDGSYAFTGLVAGTYVVAEVQQAGWQQLFPPVGSAGGVFSDPEGDTFGLGGLQLDIASVQGSVLNGQLILRADFFTPIAAPSSGQPNAVYGAWELDLDQNQTTGTPSWQSILAPSGQKGGALGVEFFVNLRSEKLNPGFVEILTGEETTRIGWVPITYGEKYCEVEIPLELLGDDGVLNYAAVIGTDPEFTDAAPNTQFGTTDTDQYTWRGTHPVVLAGGQVIADVNFGNRLIHDDGPATFSITSVSRPEGDAGTTEFVFTVSLSAAVAFETSVSFATAEGTAKLADNDYQATAGTLTFAAGEQSKTITVLVFGDTKLEGHETFFVNLSDARLDGQTDSRIAITGAQGIGTIESDDTAAIVGAKSTSPEGTEIVLTSSTAGLGNETFAYAWSVTKDGVPVALDSTAMFRFTPDDGAATYVVSLSVTDEGTEVGHAESQTILVTNVAPTIALDGPPTVNEGATYTLVLGPITDPGADTVTQWIVHWGDGTSSTYTSGGEVTHLYADDNPTGTASDSHTITVDLVDDDGTHLDAGHLEITVANVAPLVSLGDDATIEAGDTFASSGGFTDPGADAWTATVDYGDGSGSRPLSLNADKTFDLNHTYADEGEYLVTVTVMDDDSGAHSESLTVYVIARIPYHWQNPAHPCDVTNDEWITAGDVLAGINEINNRGARQLPVPPQMPDAPPPFFDVSGDNWLDALDVLLVINYINKYGSGPISDLPSAALAAASGESADRANSEGEGMPGWFSGGRPDAGLDVFGHRTVLPVSSRAPAAADRVFAEIGAVRSASVPPRSSRREPLEDWFSLLGQPAKVELSDRGIGDREDWHHVLFAGHNP